MTATSEAESEKSADVRSPQVVVKRICKHPGCGAVLSRYNQYDTCLRHPLPNGYIAKDGRALTAQGRPKKVP